MSRRCIVALTALAVAGVGVVPSHAATPKKKPNLTGKYDVMLPPDPSQDVMTNVKAGCNGVTGKSTDNHPFTVPGKGTLTVTLTSPDPSGKGATDWALWLMDSDGIAIDHSDATGSNEQTTTPFRKKQTFVIQTCNIAGLQDGHISFVFKYA